MWYAVYVPPDVVAEGECLSPGPSELIFMDIKDANLALKKYRGSRMKTFNDRSRAYDFLKNPSQDESFYELDTSQDVLQMLERLNLGRPTPSQSAPKRLGLTEPEPSYESPKPGLLNQLRRKIEAGDRDDVEEMIWSNPRFLVTVSDSAVYLMAGFKYNACHIAARANRPDIMALLLDTISNFSFLRKLYRTDSDSQLQERVNHLLDSYLNTPDVKLGNTPLHFACKAGHYKVVRVLLTFEGCDLTLRDSNGQTARESICSQYKPKPAREEEDSDKTAGDQEPDDDSEVIKSKIKRMFKHQLHLPLHRDQLKKRLLLERRRSKVGSQMDSDTSFSDLDDSFILNSPTKPKT